MSDEHPRKENWMISDYSNFQLSELSNIFSCNYVVTEDSLGGFANLVQKSVYLVNIQGNHPLSVSKKKR